jgi:hypothetical protein
LNAELSCEIRDKTTRRRNSLNDSDIGRKDWQSLQTEFFANNHQILELADELEMNEKKF